MKRAAFLNFNVIICGAIGALVGLAGCGDTTTATPALADVYNDGATDVEYRYRPSGDRWQTIEEELTASEGLKHPWSPLRATWGTSLSVPAEGLTVEIRDPKTGRTSKREFPAGKGTTWYLSTLGW